MASRGSKLSRSVDYFRTAPLDEARVAFTLVQEVMQDRVPVKTRVVKTRKRKARYEQSASHPDVAVLVEEK